MTKQNIEEDGEEAPRSKPSFMNEVLEEAELRFGGHIYHF